jgi:hypothetical protein
MTQKSITVFDPAMCCSTGVCGPEVDPRLARFSADLEWLAAQGVSVRRFNLAQEPGAFAEDAEAKAALQREVASALPLIKAGNDVVSSGTYPTRAELSNWAGLASAKSHDIEEVVHLLAVAEEIASHHVPQVGVEQGAAAPEVKSGCCGSAPASGATKEKSGCC